MSASFAIFTKIVGEDLLSPAFRKVSEAAKSAFAPVKAFNKAVGEPKTTALGQLGLAVDGVAAKFRGGLGSLSSWLPALGALGSAATLGGLIAMTRRSSEGFDSLATSAQKLGLSTKELSLFRYAAKLANVESETLEKGLAQLNKRMYDAATGKNKDVAALFAAMKIPLRDASGKVKDAGSSLEDIAEAFRLTGNSSTRTAMAMALFGKAGADLIPFLVKGKDGLAELRVEMARYSGLTDKHRNDLGELDTAYKRLDKAGSGLASRLSAAMAPALIKVVDWTTNWIVANRDLIAQSLERKLDSIGRAIKWIGEVASSIVELPFIGELLKGADAGTAFDVALGVLGLTMTGPAFAAIQMVTGAILRMNLALLSNPFMLVAAAVAFAAYAIYANWGPIKEWFGQQIAAIAKAFDEGWVQGIYQAIIRFNPANIMMQAMNGLVKWLFGIDLAEAGAKMMRTLIDGIKSLLPDFNAIWAPVDRAISWAGGKLGSGLKLITDQGFAGSEAGIPPIGMPTAPSPGAAAVTNNTVVSNKLEITVNKAGPDASVSVKDSGSGPAAFSTNVGTSMQGAY